MVLLTSGAGQARKVLGGADRPTCHTDLCITTIPVQQFMTNLPDPLRRHLSDRILLNQNPPLLPCSHMRPERRKMDFQPRRRGALLTGVYLSAAAAVVFRLRRLEDPSSIYELVPAFFGALVAVIVLSLATGRGASSTAERA